MRGARRGSETGVVNDIIRRTILENASNEVQIYKIQKNRIHN